MGAELLKRGGRDSLLDNEAACSLLLGVVIGLPVGIGRVYGPRWLQRILGAYVTLFQGTPLPRPLPSITSIISRGMHSMLRTRSI